jgi:hypothetical protein
VELCVPAPGRPEITDVALLSAPQARPKPGEVALASFEERRDWRDIAHFQAALETQGLQDGYLNSVAPHRGRPDAAARR